MLTLSFVTATMLVYSLWYQFVFSFQRAYFTGNFYLVFINSGTNTTQTQNPYSKNNPKSDPNSNPKLNPNLDP